MLLYYLNPLYTVLIEDSNSDPTAKDILNFMVTFNFLATTYLLAFYSMDTKLGPVFDMERDERTEIKPMKIVFSFKNETFTL